MLEIILGLIIAIYFGPALIAVLVSVLAGLPLIPRIITIIGLFIALMIYAPWVALMIVIIGAIASAMMFNEWTKTHPKAMDNIGKTLLALFLAAVIGLPILAAMGF